MTEIVVGVDGSEQSAEALRWAAREAGLREAGLTAVLVWDLFNQRHPDGSKKFDPAYDERKADAALLALGSVSQQCLHHAPGPIAIVRSVPAHEGSDRVVVGLDGSPPSNAALRWGLAEGIVRGATLHVVHAWELPAIFGPVGAGTFPYDTEAVQADAQRFVDELVGAALADAGSPDVAIERTVRPGGAASAVLEAAEGADLVVIGRRGAGGFSRLLLGSVSENVARHAPCPVVVMPPEREADS
jgi:nucleotide-binding universal stress UspA family protein